MLVAAIQVLVEYNYPSWNLIDSQWNRNRCENVKQLQIIATQATMSTIVYRYPPKYPIPVHT